MTQTIHTHPLKEASLWLPQRRSQVEHRWREVVMRRSQTIIRGPVPLYTEAYGDPLSPYPVLCTHGLWQSLDAWREQCAFLAQSGCYVVAWDLPFHGLSGPFGESSHVSPDFWAECLRAVIEEYDLFNVLLLAWSFGGLVVGDYLCRFGSTGLAGLVLVGSALLDQEGETEWMTNTLALSPSLAGLLSTDRLERLQAVPPFFLLLTATPQAPADRYRTLLSMQHAAWRLDGSVLIQGRTMSRSLPPLAHLPTLLIAGEHDPCFPPEVVQSSRTYVPQAESLVYPCGHFPMREAAALLNTDVLHFVFQAHRQRMQEAALTTEAEREQA